MKTPKREPAPPADASAGFDPERDWVVADLASLFSTARSRSTCPSSFAAKRLAIEGNGPQE